jgi:hypothetical protein
MRTHLANPGQQNGTRACVFGLDVQAGLRIPFLEGTRIATSVHRLQLDFLRAGSADLGWPDGASVLCSRRADDGSEQFRIEADPQAGYLIWGARPGSFQLTSDARRLRCAPGSVAAETWERFLIGQVLPFAALVAGLEIFHASAVVWHGHAVALAGPSGAGKTSLALALCQAGATLLVDDVLALQGRGRRLLAYPGPALLAVDQAEAKKRRSDVQQPPPPSVLASNLREELRRVHPARGAAELSSLFFLDRRSDGPSEPRFIPVTDPRMLLGATFNFALATPDRLRRLLAVSALASEGRVERILASATLEAPQLARAITRRLGAAS